MNVMRSPELLQRQSSRILIVDLQEKFLGTLSSEVQRQLIAVTRFLCEGAKTLGVPITATEQYPQKMGDTVAALAEFASERPSKKRFSAVECTGWPTASEATDDRFQVVVCGMETHVCILQTVLDLLAYGYQVYVVVDAVAGRGATDHAAAIERMANSGAILTTAESVIFEWCETAEAAEFKQISALVKGRQG